MGRAQLGVRSANGKAQRAQSRGIVARPQADVGKDDAIAAEPASGAKRRDGGSDGILPTVQTTLKLRLNASHGNALPILVLPCQGILLQGLDALTKRTTL